MKQFRKELENLINRHSRENGSDTPDFILARYLTNALEIFDTAVKEREQWYSRAPELSDEDMELLKNVPFPSAEEAPPPKDWKQEILNTDFGDDLDDLPE
jgi:hypothetical protein